MTETDMPGTVSEVCDAAADFIETHGWHQGGIHAGDSPIAEFGAAASDWRPGVAVCAWGGLLGACGELGADAFRAEPGLSLSWKAVIALEDHVGRVGQVGSWNDDPARTQAEVVQALRDTATKHRHDAMRDPGCR